MARIFMREPLAARNITKTARMTFSIVEFSKHGPSDAMKFDHFLLKCAFYIKSFSCIYIYICINETNQ